ncbi:MAG: dienelactone hydrolase family protein [Pseudomonadales bacterium]
MNRILKYSFLTLAALAAILAIAYFVVGGRAGIVSKLVPFPDQAIPQTTLSADSSGEVRFASATPFDFDVLIAGMQYALPTTGLGHLFLPANASVSSPAPAVVLVHGSGGISPGREMEHGAMLAENGYAAFVIDYYTPRGATPDVDYMLRVLSVTEFDAVTDSYNALKILRTHPLIDSENIAVAGFSYGGMAARIAMDDRIRAALLSDEDGFAAHIDFYGPCFQQLNSPKLTSGPLLTLRGTEDASNELSACEKREQEILTAGNTVETHVFEGAGHAWDNHSERSMRPDSPYLSGCTMSYDEKGHSAIGDRSVVNMPVETSRDKRIANRVLSSGPARDCLGYGYVVGRDDKTRAKADAIMLRFLSEHLK